MAENKFLVPLAIVIAGGLIAVSIYFGGGGGGLAAGTRTTPDPSSVDVPAVTAADHIVGSRDAKVVIVEYSDTECPFCKVFHNTLRQVMSDYNGKVAWVYRQFPIAELHSKAPKEAEATECAAELGGNEGFWNFTHKLFDTTNSNDSLDPSELPRIAASVGLDVTAFNSCLASGKYKDKIAKSVNEAFAVGAGGTPYSFLISGNKKVVINGAESLAAVRAKIDALLQ
jgi:protein-disulfide isomerase